MNTSTITRNDNAERAFLGCLISTGLRWTDDEDFIKIVHYVSPKHFADDFHAEIFEAIQARLDVGGYATRIRLRMSLRKNPEYKRRGGENYLALLVAYSFLNEDHFALADEIIEAANNRALVAANDDLKSMNLSGFDLPTTGESLCSAHSDGIDSDQHQGFPVNFRFPEIVFHHQKDRDERHIERSLRNTVAKENWKKRNTWFEDYDRSFERYVFFRLADELEKEEGIIPDNEDFYEELNLRFLQSQPHMRIYVRNTDGSVVTGLPNFDE